MNNVNYCHEALGIHRIFLEKWEACLQVFWPHLKTINSFLIKAKEYVHVLSLLKPRRKIIKEEGNTGTHNIRDITYT